MKAQPYMQRWRAVLSRQVRHCLPLREQSVDYTMLRYVHISPFPLYCCGGVAAIPVTRGDTCLLAQKLSGGGKESYTAVE